MSHTIQLRINRIKGGVIKVSITILYWLIELLIRTFFLPTSVIVCCQLIETIFAFFRTFRQENLQCALSVIVALSNCTWNVLTIGNSVDSDWWVHCKLWQCDNNIIVLIENDKYSMAPYGQNGVIIDWWTNKTKYMYYNNYWGNRLVHNINGNFLS